MWTFWQLCDYLGEAPIDLGEVSYCCVSSGRWEMGVVGGSWEIFYPAEVINRPKNACEHLCRQIFSGSPSVLPRCVLGCIPVFAIPPSCFTLSSVDRTTKWKECITEMTTQGLKCLHCWLQYCIKRMKEQDDHMNIILNQVSKGSCPVPVNTMPDKSRRSLGGYLTVLKHSLHTLFDKGLRKRKTRGHWPTKAGELS